MGTTSPSNLPEAYDRERELKSHAEGYRGFVHWMTWGAIALAVTTAIVIWLIAA